VGNYKILIIPSLGNPYDVRMVQGLAEGFNSIGVSAKAKNKKISSEEILNECKDFKYNVVLKINEVRGSFEQELKDIRVISWYQDIYCDTEEKLKMGLQANDILYTMGDRKVLGIVDDIKVKNEILLTAVAPDLLSLKNKHMNYYHDFSICGFIPKNVENESVRESIKRAIKVILLKLVNKGIINIENQKLIKKIKNINNNKIDSALRALVESNYHSLTGSLDINQIEKIIKNSFSNHEVLSEEKLNYYAQTYPRKIDRINLVNELLEFTTSIGLYGPNWDTYPILKKYHKGVITDRMNLMRVYQGTKINLANNTHGIGIHSRTLEVMAVGGFVATHESENDELTGGILDGFTPDRHFCYYRKGEIRQECQKWLEDNNRRIAAGESAREVVRDKHLWIHRAKKIIEDLAA
jgi:hypothetical protein